MSRIDDLYAEQLTEQQKVLRDKHGTPPEFAAAAYKTVPAWISMDEAKAAVDKYNEEWFEAGRPSPAA